jgi:hypothetical protein
VAPWSLGLERLWATDSIFSFSSLDSQEKRRMSRRKQLAALEETLLSSDVAVGSKDKKDKKEEEEKLRNQIKGWYNDLELSPTKAQDALQNVKNLGLNKKVINELVSVGFVPRLTKFLHKPFESELLASAVWILADVSSVNSYASVIAQQSSFLQRLIDLLKQFTHAIEHKLHFSLRVFENVIICLGNIVSENIAWRNFLIKRNCINYLVRCINVQLKTLKDRKYKSLKPEDFTPPLIWCLSECMSDSPYPKWKLLCETIPTLLELLNHPISIEFVQKQKQMQKKETKDAKKDPDDHIPELMQDLLERVFLSVRSLFYAAENYDSAKIVQLVSQYGPQATPPYDHIRELVNTDICMSLLKFIEIPFLQTSFLEVVNKISECSHLSFTSSLLSVPNFLTQFRLTFFHHVNTSVVKQATFILCNLAITTLESQLFIIQDHGIGPFLSFYLSKKADDAADKENKERIQIIQDDLARFLDNLVYDGTKISYRALIMNWNLVPILSHALTTVKFEATLLTLLSIIYRLLHLDFLFSPSRELASLFIQNGLLDHLDNLQGNSSDKIYNLTVNILVHFFDATADSPSH